MTSRAAVVATAEAVQNTPDGRTEIERVEGVGFGTATGLYHVASVDTAFELVRGGGHIDKAR